MPVHALDSKMPASLNGDFEHHQLNELIIFIFATRQPRPLMLGKVIAGGSCTF